MAVDDHRPLREELADQRELIARLVTVVEHVVAQLDSIATILMLDLKKKSPDA